MVSGKGESTEGVSDELFDLLFEVLFHGHDPWALELTLCSE